MPWLIAGATGILGVAILSLLLSDSTPSEPDASFASGHAVDPMANPVHPGGDTERTAAGRESEHRSDFSRYAGSESCRECHPTQFGGWEPSNHGLAERLVNPAKDRTAFDPPREFAHGTQSTSVAWIDGTGWVTTKGPGGTTERFAAERVIGESPLRQFLVSVGDGRMQALETAWDPHGSEWFNVYGDEDRQPGEWGHWTGRGMNWNSMCATCHNTALRKNYDEATDRYDTVMAERTVGCEACHGPMRAHVEWRRAGYPPETSDPTVSARTPDQILDTCGSCHSRRAELTGHFEPGDRYFDHHSLVIPNESELYYPDGQVLEEDYVFASFLGSRMYHAGVRCLDCHDPHTTRLILPGNALCMRCHAGGYPNSPLIDPAAHSRHDVSGGGGQCVDCHMPQTTYMQRHPRRDHGFTIPDPWLTVNYGVPNACNRCHTDKDAAWALERVDAWYGDRMKRHTRDRATWIADARRDAPNARAQVLAMLSTEPMPFWRAVAADLLDLWPYEPEVVSALTSQLTDPDPMVRGSAALSLEPAAQQRFPAVGTALEKLLTDPIRHVRVQAAWALRDRVAPGSVAGKDLLGYLAHHGDQPRGALQKAVYHLARGEYEPALKHAERAVTWDPNSAPLRQEYAVALSMAGRTDQAVRELEAAILIDPGEAQYHYLLALAWSELGSLDKTVASLTEAVRLNPAHGRAWYNLGLAQNEMGQPEAAIETLVRAESVSPRDPEIPYARATILARTNRRMEARRAADRALELAPNYGAAAELLRSLGY